MTAAPVLSGLTVVSLEQAVAAPFATRQLADLGARVIKIERPGTGDFARGYDESVHGNSSYFVWLNRSKESLTLDVKAPEGRRILGELIERADVFVQNLGPGAAARLGTDAATLRRAHPDLITCTISGWGTDGPWADRKAYDLLVQCETGLLSVTGTPGEMVKAGISVADIAAGMYAYSGVLTALLRRSLSGEATAVEVSLFEALAEWMGAPAYYTAGSGRPPVRAGAAHATIAPYGPYRTADGTVLLAVQNEREWRRLCDCLLGGDGQRTAEDPRFAVNSARVGHRGELDELLGAAIGARPSEEVTALLDKAGIANARIRDMPGFLDHPVLSGRDRWQPVDVPGGTVSALRPPADLRADGAGIEPVMGPVPAVGAHTDAILAELGRDPETIARLRAGSVI